MNPNPTSGLRADTPGPSGGVFVTGTDTGVGKTWAGARLVTALAGRGMRVAPRKPVESGWIEGRVAETDAAILAAAVPGGMPLETICRWRFPDAVSPARAAGLAGTQVHLAQVVAACEVPQGAFAVIEGAGGFYSPLTTDALNADLSEALGLPVVLVAPDRLGCINHVLLCAEAMERRGLGLLAVILNRMDAQPDPAMDNASELAGYLECPILRSGCGESPGNGDRWIEELGDLVIGAP